MMNEGLFIFISLTFIEVFTIVVSQDHRWNQNKVFLINVQGNVTQMMMMMNNEWQEKSKEHMNETKQSPEHEDM